MWRGYELLWQSLLDTMVECRLGEERQWRVLASLSWRRPIRLDQTWVIGYRRLAVIRMWCEMRRLISVLTGQSLWIKNWSSL